MLYTAPIALRPHERHEQTSLTTGVSLATISSNVPVGTRSRESSLFLSPTNTEAPPAYDDGLPSRLNGSPSSSAVLADTSPRNQTSREAVTKKEGNGASLERQRAEMLELQAVLGTQSMFQTQPHLSGEQQLQRNLVTDKGDESPPPYTPFGYSAPPFNLAIISSASHGPRSSVRPSDIMTTTTTTMTTIAPTTTTGWRHPSDHQIMSSLGHSSVAPIISAPASSLPPLLEHSSSLLLSTSIGSASPSLASSQPDTLIRSSEWLETQEKANKERMEMAMGGVSSTQYVKCNDSANADWSMWRPLDRVKGAFCRVKCTLLRLGAKVSYLIPFMFTLVYELLYPVFPLST